MCIRKNDCKVSTRIGVHHKDSLTGFYNKRVQQGSTAVASRLERTAYENESEARDAHDSWSTSSNSETLPLASSRFPGSSKQLLLPVPRSSRLLVSPCRCQDLQIRGLEAPPLRLVDDLDQGQASFAPTGEAPRSPEGARQQAQSLVWKAVVCASGTGAELHCGTARSKYDKDNSLVTDAVGIPNDSTSCKRYGEFKAPPFRTQRQQLCPVVSALRNTMPPFVAKRASRIQTTTKTKRTVTRGQRVCRCCCIEGSAPS